VSRWAKGADQVTALIEAHHLQRVIADADTVDALLGSARRHVESARLTVGQDPEAAYSLAYDAGRKSATALLNHQGLRPTTSGGHLVVVDVIRAQFPGVPGLISLDRTGSAGAATRPNIPTPAAGWPKAALLRSNSSTDTRFGLR
jgi:hypothetical protein